MHRKRVDPMNPETNPDLSFSTTPDHAGLYHEAIVLEVQGLCVQFDGLDLIRDFGGQVHAGECVALVGSEGAGKTLLLQVLMGMRPFQEGSVRVLGAQPADMAYCTRVGWVQQQARLSENLSVRELIELFGSFAHLSLPIHDVLAWTGLQDHADTHFGRLSLLHQQLTRLATVVCSRPELLMLDAPTEGLNTDEQELYWLQVQQLLAPEQTVVFTTRSLEEATRYADRLIHLG